MLRYKIEPRNNETNATGHIDHTVIPVWFELARTPVYQLFNPDMADLDGEDALQRIVALCPETPVIMHTRYHLPFGLQDSLPNTAEIGPNLVTALRTLLLHAMQVPLRAQA